MKFNKRFFDRLEPDHIERFRNSILRQALRKAIVEDLEMLCGKLGKNYTVICKMLYGNKLEKSYNELLNNEL